MSTSPSYMDSFIESMEHVANRSFPPTNFEEAGRPDAIRVWELETASVSNTIEIGAIQTEIKPVQSWLQDICKSLESLSTIIEKNIRNIYILDEYYCYHIINLGNTPRSSKIIAIYDKELIVVGLIKVGLGEIISQIYTVICLTRSKRNEEIISVHSQILVLVN